MEPKTLGYAIFRSPPKESGEDIRYFSEGMTLPELTGAFVTGHVVLSSEMPAMAFTDKFKEATVYNEKKTAVEWLARICRNMSELGIEGLHQNYKIGVCNVYVTFPVHLETHPLTAGDE